LLNLGDGRTMGRFHDDMRSASWAREIAGLVEAADHVPGAIGEKCLALVYDLAQLFVADVLDTLHGAVAPLQIGTDIGLALLERAIKDRTPEIPRVLSIPHIRDRTLLHIPERFRHPVLTTEIDVAAIAPTAQNLEPGKGLGAEEPLGIAAGG